MVSLKSIECYQNENEIKYAIHIPYNGVGVEGVTELKIDEKYVFPTRIERLGPELDRINGVLPNATGCGIDYYVYAKA